MANSDGPTKICPKCDGVNQVSAKFCSKCGYPFSKASLVSSGGNSIDQPEVACPKCGTKRQTKDKFCRKCGYQFEVSPSSEESKKSQSISVGEHDSGTSGKNAIHIIISITAILLIILVGVYHSHPSQPGGSLSAQSSSKSSRSNTRFSNSDKKNAEEVTRDLNRYNRMRWLDDLTNPQAHFSVDVNDNGGIAVNIPYNTEVIDQANVPNPDVNWHREWDDLAALVKRDSGFIEKDGGNSLIEIANPLNSDRSLLTVEAGKIKYNIIDDH